MSIDVAALRALYEKANSYPYSIHDSDALTRALVYAAPALLDAAETMQQSDKFFIGDKVQVVLEGTLMGYNRDDGHYYMVGHAGDHVPWLYTLHWSTPFRVLEPGPRDLGDGATTSEEAWAKGLQS